MLRFGAAALVLTLPIIASAHWGGNHGTVNHSWHSQTQRHERITQKPTPEVNPQPVTAPIPAPQNPSSNGSEKQILAYITGYSYYDNTPPGSTDISNGVLHSKAGGTGSFTDPITLAVGHVISGSKDTLDYAAGTRFYIPDLRRYFMVEDTCGDGNSPQSGPCHTGYQGHPWLDVYVGQGASKSASDACMDKITEIHEVLINPAPNYPVVVGDIASNCALY